VAEYVSPGPTTSAPVVEPVVEPVTAAIRELRLHDVDAVAVQEGARVMVNCQDFPASTVWPGEIVTLPSEAAVPTGRVVTPHPVGGAEIVTDRRATEVDPKSDGTRIVQVSVR
jgi:hypothetical protein